MTGDELSRIPGLEQKHTRVLAELGVTSTESLAAADQRRIHGAMRRLRPRPTLDDIAAWQEHARRHGSAVVETEWERAATFVVSFEQRRGNSFLPLARRARLGIWRKSRRTLDTTNLSPQAP